MVSDGKGVIGPRKSYKQKLEEMEAFGASWLPDGEGGREGHQAPFRGPNPGLWIRLDSHQRVLFSRGVT